MIIKPSLILSAFMFFLAFLVLSIAGKNSAEAEEPWAVEINPERYVDLYNYQSLYRDSRLDRLIEEATKDRKITLEEEARIVGLTQILDKERKK